MSRTDRRDFLKQSATIAVAGAGVSAGNLREKLLSQREIAEWESRVGSFVRVDDAELVLKSVTATDHSGDAARPRHLRTHSIALLFTQRSGRLTGTGTHFLQQNGRRLMLTEVVPPRGEHGRYFESIVN